MGYKHPDFMLQELTSTQLKELEIFYEESQHFEEDRFLQAGIIASVIVNWSGKTLKKSANDLPPSNFMPYYKEIVKQQGVEEMIQAMRTTTKQPKVKKKRKKNG